MSKKTEIVVKNKVSLFEHRFVSGEAVLSHEAQQYRDLQEHRLFGVNAEHLVLGVVSEHRNIDIIAEHHTLDIDAEHLNQGYESGLDPLVLDQAILKLTNPHMVSSVTLQRRSDGSFFLIIEE